MNHEKKLTIEEPPDFTILIVGNSYDEARIICRFLRFQGLNIDFVFTDNLFNLEKLITERYFDVILLELTLPDLKALKIGYALKEKYAYLKILLTTLHNDLWMIQVAYNLNFTGFVCKQSNVDEFYFAIDSIIRDERYFDKELRHGINQNVEPMRYYFRKLPLDLHDVYPLIVRGVAIPLIAKQLGISEVKVKLKMNRIFKITKTKSVVELIVYNYKKESNDFMVFEEMMRYRPKSFLPTKPLFKTLGIKKAES